MKDHAGTKRAITAVVTGRVQGVGYRYTTQRVGQRLGLVGWVRNEADGSVTVRAQGDSETVSRFIDFLDEGPPAARVETATVTDQPLDRDLSGFRVSY